jgi:hypothetical protein
MLKVSELAAEKKKKNDETKKIYKEFLTECYKRIKLRNKQNYYTLLYTVPIIAMGKSLYSVEIAIEYIILKLRKGGFHAFLSHGTTISIDWSHIASTENRIEREYTPLNTKKRSK